MDEGGTKSGDKMINQSVATSTSCRVEQLLYGPLSLRDHESRLALTTLIVVAHRHRLQQSLPKHIAIPVVLP